MTPRHLFIFSCLFKYVGFAWIGFDEIVLQWLKSYLTCRHFQVKVNKTVSGGCYITIGVPQGSILGPLLFILFTKELEDIAKKYGFCFHCYADDCQIYFCFKSPSDVSNLSACLSEVKLWMTAHFLKLNDNKTEVLNLYPFYAQSKTIDEVQFHPNTILSKVWVSILILNYRWNVK